MGDFWDGFDFPTLDPQTTTPASVNTVIEETPQ